MNLTPDTHRPYVGRSAFAHKGGLHVDGISKDPATYEHVAPEAVGNVRRTPVGELSGKNSIRTKAEELGLEAGDATRILGAIQRREYEGYHYEAADASLALLDRADHRGRQAPLRVGDVQDHLREAHRRGDDDEATIKLSVGGHRVISTAEGNGPVNALDQALRKAIGPHYPELKEIHLSNYKVRILDEHRATAATTRVLIDSTNGKSMWGAVRRLREHHRSLLASLVDGLEFGVHGTKKA